MKKAVFLDRDGTVNVDKNYLFRVEDFEYEDGVIESLQKLEQMGFLLIIITNQSGIARGYYSEKDFHKLNDWMLIDLEEKGIHISAVYHCPHHPQGKFSRYTMDCDCRKPKTGLFWRAQKELQIDMDHSYAIGDKSRDLSICNESGVKGILLYSPGDNDKRGQEDNIWICKNLKEAAQMIINYERKYYDFS